MFVVTSEQMQQIDEETIDRVCPGIELMERAGRGVADVILHEFNRRDGHSDGEAASLRVAIFVGPGNNGGDGLVVARYLHQAGWTCSVHLLKRPADMTVDTAKNYQRLQDIAPQIPEFDATRSDYIAQAEQDLLDADLLIDAVFGTGITGAPRSPAMDMIQLINDQETPVISIDIPSGINGSTGESPGEAVFAQETITIGTPKFGSLFHPGRWHCGEVSVIDIGFPEDIIEKYASPCYLLDAGEAAARLPWRPPDVHKFDAGTMIVIAGSVQYRGAALLSAEAALRSGCGMVYLAVPASIRGEIDVALREAITIPLPETPDGTIARDAAAVLAPYMERAHAVAIGPGLGRNDDTDAFVRDFVSDSEIPMVVDADAINAFVGHVDALSAVKAELVLTPHTGELSRLLGEEIPEGTAERVAATATIAERLGVTLVHKGAPSLIGRAGDGVWINSAGDSSLATGGTGDVLTGLIGGMLAQGAEPLDAACVASFLHGKAGEEASSDMGKRGVIASDLLWAVGRAMVQLESLVGD